MFKEIFKEIVLVELKNQENKNTKRNLFVNDLTNKLDNMIKEFNPYFKKYGLMLNYTKYEDKEKYLNSFNGDEPYNYTENIFNELNDDFICLELFTIKQRFNKNIFDEILTIFIGNEKYIYYIEYGELPMNIYNIDKPLNILDDKSFWSKIIKENVDLNNNYA